MNNNPADDLDLLAKAKLNLETSQLPWTDLQRFFASGSLISVAASLDLVEVAHQFSIDNKTQVELWLKAGQVHRVTDAQAMNWLDTHALLWTTVVRPWVLVQEG